MPSPAGRTDPLFADCAIKWSRGSVSLPQPSKIGRPRGWPANAGRLMAQALWTISRSELCDD